VFIIYIFAVVIYSFAADVLIMLKFESC